MALFKPSMGPLVSRCAKKVSRLGRWFLHRRATFFTGFNRHRIAQPYHLSKYRPACFTVGHDQKVRKLSLIAQARAVCKFSRLSFSKPSACLIGTFSCPYSQSDRVCLSRSSPCSSKRRCSSLRTSLTASFIYFTR